MIACEQCGKAATCTGLYEGGRSALKCKRNECAPKLEQCSDAIDAPACDDCCDHANSKRGGHCHKITQTKDEPMSQEQDARRYQRLRVIGVAPNETPHLKNGTVLCFTNLDAFVDDDIKRMPSRGEAAAPDSDERFALVEKHAQAVFAEIDRVLARARDGQPEEIFALRNNLCRDLRVLFSEVRSDEEHRLQKRMRERLLEVLDEAIR